MTPVLLTLPCSPSCLEPKGCQSNNLTYPTLLSPFSLSLPRVSPVQDCPKPLVLHLGELQVTP